MIKSHPHFDNFKDDPAQLSIEIKLSKPGGYDGKVVISINEENPDFFETNWTGSDPTRFPARIKAAATALKELGFQGKYLVNYKSQGILVVSKTHGSLKKL